MGQVIAVFKIMPSDIESYDKMKENVLDAVGEAEKVEEDYVAFGLKALKVTVLLPDAAGGTDVLEQKLAALEGVGSVELDGIGRL